MCKFNLKINIDITMNIDITLGISHQNKKKNKIKFLKDQHSKLL